MKLSLVVERYITLKQSLGFRFRTEIRILKGFCRTLGKVSMGQVRPGAVHELLGWRWSRHRLLGS